MDFVGCVKEVFVIHWACLFGQASGGGETRCWPSNYVGVKDIGTWDLEGFVGNLVVWGHPRYTFPFLFLGGRCKLTSPIGEVLAIQFVVCNRESNPFR